jgi:hypothetical protein
MSINVFGLFRPRNLPLSGAFRTSRSVLRGLFHAAATPRDDTSPLHLVPPMPGESKPSSAENGDDRLCVCGHNSDAHQHFRSGTDCSLCGASECKKYRPKRK